MTETREPIERIRAEAKAVLRKHEQRKLGLGPGCAFCRVAFPCDAFRLAEDKLKLAEAAAHLVEVAGDEEPERWAAAVYAIEKALAEVAGEERSDG